MPDEADRFGGLGDALQSGSDEDPSDADASSTETTTASPAVPEAPSESADESEPADTVDAVDDVEEFPEPFGFDETNQQSYYVRDETFDPLAANRSRIRAVASKHGLDEGDLSKRELHDAELSVLQSFEDWDIAVAVEVLERRGVDVDEEAVRAVFDVLR
ncbi:hypothetical protein [Halobaculum marinum]|uniref:Uncharacterized protein n=1 Tax=Halobaculum marinum TaxID=3031996 RepID=A0ABD5WTD5_9EURY|nr:hypothetical protein [Halobaculum sp. DT55]